MLTLIDKILDAMLALMGQLIYFEQKSNNPEVVYGNKKSAMENALADNNVNAIDAAIDDVCPPKNLGPGSNNSK